MDPLTLKAVIAISVVALLCGGLLVVGTFGYFTQRLEHSHQKETAVRLRSNEQTRSVVEGRWRDMQGALDEMRMIHADVLEVHRSQQSA